ncbi:MAG: type III pantothenate kinase [Planctomycetota bacterium]
MATLVIDIGNSLLSWRHRDSSGEIRFGSATHLAIADVLVDLPVADAIAISSVQRAHEATIKKWLADGHRDDAHWIHSGADLPSSVLTDHPETTGADRALCALAWGASSDGRDALLIDAGSAVTVDAVTAAGQLQGGWIAPGFHSLLLGLQQVAPSLPEISPRDPGEEMDQGPWACESRASIEGGLRTMFIGGVQALRDRVLAGFSDDPAIIVTGGDAPLLIDFLQGAIHRPAMVLDGLEVFLDGIQEDV